MPRFSICFALITGLVAAAGCGGGPVAAPVEPDKARTALRTTLDAWKAGQKPDTLAQARPPIVAQDMDWLAGATLTDYQLLDDGKAEDANLRARVKLSLKSDRGKTMTKTAVYVVGTDPTLTVFRAME